MAKPLLAGNWKMHGTAESAAQLAADIADGLTLEAPETVVFPPLVHLPLVIAKLAERSGIAVGAQNVSEHAEGAYTGEVSAQMLANLGCRYALVGHSERRTLFGETDQLVAEKFATLQGAGLTPVLCVGETLDQRQQGLTLEVVKSQIDAVVASVGLDNVCRAVVAYEPVWAIGTGETATPEQAQEVHAYIRGQLAEQGRSTRLLYGGSVNADNAAALFAQPDIDGGLVGGASLQAQQFLNIAQQMVEQG
jgi:triosephosphate isomerase